MNRQAGKKDKRKGQEGFTLIEAVTAMALLTVIASGFLMMSGANAGLLARELGMGRSSYGLVSMAEEGLGEATGNSFVVEFQMEPDSGFGGYGAEERFDEFEVSKTPEDNSGSMTFYRHR